MDPVTVLKENLRALMQHHEIDTQTKLGKLAGLSQSTVGRMLSGAHAAQIDSVQAVAAVFDMSAWQLLVPGLDPKNPPTYLTRSERDLYRRMQESARAITNLS